jgi:hypothetical protein
MGRAKEEMTENESKAPSRSSFATRSLDFE